MIAVGGGVIGVITEGGCVIGGRGGVVGVIRVVVG